MEGGGQSQKDGDRRRTPSQQDGEEKQGILGPPPASALGPNATQAVVSGNQAGEARGSWWPMRDTEE